MPLVQMTLLEGRDAATRAALIRELTEAVVRTTAVDPQQVRVLLYEVPAASWGVGGVSKAERA